MNFNALDYLAGKLLNKRWIFAKTMPESPHWYTLRKEWNTDAEFSEVVYTLRKNSYIEHYKGYAYQMFNINGMKYWTMGAPLKETILINRAFVNLPQDYDEISSTYDNLFVDDESMAENKHVIDMIGWREGESVLDIGCGTGLFLDYCNPVDYVGIDPSGGMLSRLKERHRKYSENVLQTKFEDYSGGKKDLVISLFASASYIHPEAISRMLSFVKAGGRYFIMFFNDGYVPMTYVKTGITLSHFKGNHHLLRGEQINAGNFVIVTGTA